MTMVKKLKKLFVKEKVEPVNDTWSGYGHTSRCPTCNGKACAKCGLEYCECHK